MRTPTLPAAFGDFIEARSPRERVLLGAGLLAGAVYLAVTLVWQPLQEQRGALADRIARHDRALSALAAQPALSAAPNDLAADDPRPLNIILTETAADFQIAIRRLEPEGQSAALTLDDAGFETVILWLDALEADQGLRLNSIELTRRPTPGTVSARLVLERERQ